MLKKRFQFKESHHCTSLPVQVPSKHILGRQNGFQIEKKACSPFEVEDRKGKHCRAGFLREG